MIIWVITILYAAMVAATLIFEYGHSQLKDNQVKYTVAKCITSILFIVLAIIAFALSGNLLFLGMAPAYLFCFGGDLFLALGHEIDNRLKNPQFIVGVISFSIAQIFICIAYLKILQWHISWTAIVGVIVLVATIFFTKNKDYDFGENALPCTIYGFFVGLAAGLGLQMIITYPENLVYVLLGAGSIVFLISDLCLTMKLFWKKEARWSGAAVLLFYYGAMWLLACGIGMWI